MSGPGAVSLVAVIRPDNTSIPATANTSHSTPPNAARRRSLLQPNLPSTTPDPYLLSPSSASMPFAAVIANSPLLESLAADCLTYAAANGITMFNKQRQLVHAPLTLLPAPIPRQCYELAQSLAPDYALLYDAVARDYDFLVQCLTQTAAADEFIANLLSILHTVQAEGSAQPPRLTINRSDYMVHSASPSSPPGLLQVEYNTIAASFAGLSSHTSAMHRYICSRHLPGQVPIASLPVNRALAQISSAIAAAFDVYKARYEEAIAGRRLVVVMVVQEGEGNAIDQKLLEYDLFEYHSVAVVRQTLRELHDHAHVDASRQLTVGDCVVAVTYYRAGYTPRDYPGEAQWTAVLKVERSLCIKCPTVAYHLAGSKKVQQALTVPGAVERYVPAEAAARVRLTFAGMWGLESDDDATEAVIRDAIAHPSNYVLKPQREGGGNNLWDDDLVRVLQDSLTQAEKRAQYILMTKIRPPEFETAVMREGAWTQARAVSELGVYSALLSDGLTVSFNNFCGHLLRTKQIGVNEGGVASGYAALDSPILT